VWYSCCHASGWGCPAPLTAGLPAPTSAKASRSPRNGKTLYVTDPGNEGAGDTVTPISTTTNKAGKPIKVGKDPGPIAITANGKTAYVANLHSGTVTPIRTATSTAGKPITVGKDPQYIAITPNGKTAYVANYYWSTVTPIRIATGKTGQAIKVGSPYAIAITR
jgi:YVTN family beta-propeller protein